MRIRMQEGIGFTLRFGVAISVLLVIAGLALMFADGGGGGYTLSQIASTSSRVNTSLFSLSAIAAAAQNLDGLGFVLLGLVVLVATPIARVVLSIAAFASERSLLYTAITLIVLINLLVALLIVPGIIAG
jgi:uncharacterized membrane protein